MLHSKQNGYTLVEVIVALGIFVTIATIATGALISILKTQQSTYDQQTAAQQLRFFQDVFSQNA
jgi:prepilin-type N-terminal cleavage/methylation domain-containing protein